MIVRVELVLKRRARPVKWKDPEERKIEDGFSVVRRVAAQLQIAEREREEGVRGRYASVVGVIDEAVTLYENAVKQGFMVSRSVHITALAILHLVCMRRGFPESAREVSEAYCVDRAQVAKVERRLLAAERKVAAHFQLPIPPEDPCRHVARIVSRLFTPGIGLRFPRYLDWDHRLQADVEGKAVMILAEARELGIGVRRTAQVLASGAVYLACRLVQLNHVQVSVAKAAGVSRSAVQESAEMLRKELAKRSIAFRKLVREFRTKHHRMSPFQCKHKHG